MEGRTLALNGLSGLFFFSHRCLNASPSSALCALSKRFACFSSGLCVVLKDIKPSCARNRKHACGLLIVPNALYDAYGTPQADIYIDTARTPSHSCIILGSHGRRHRACFGQCGTHYACGARLSTWHADPSSPAGTPSPCFGLRVLEQGGVHTVDRKPRRPSDERSSG